MNQAHVWREWGAGPQDLVEKLNKYFGGKYCISGFRSNRNGERRGRDTVQKVWMYHVWYSYYLQNEELCWLTPTKWLHFQKHGDHRVTVNGRHSVHACDSRFSSQPCFDWGPIIPQCVEPPLLDVRLGLEKKTRQVPSGHNVGQSNHQLLSFAIKEFSAAALPWPQMSPTTKHHDDHSEASDGISTSKLVCKICKLYFEAKAGLPCRGTLIWF